MFNLAKNIGESKSLKSLKTKGIADIFSNPVLVDATGFEPAASASRTQRSTKLSHASILNCKVLLTAACGLTFGAEPLRIQLH